MTTITTLCACGEKEPTVVSGSRALNFQTTGTCAGCVEETNRQDAVDAWAAKERRRPCSR